MANAPVWVDAAIPGTTAQNDRAALARFPGVSDQFSTAELLSVFEEFNSYTNKLYMDPVEFKLMMQSLNVG